MLWHVTFTQWRKGDPAHGRDQSPRIWLKLKLTFGRKRKDRWDNRSVKFTYRWEIKNENIKI